MGSSIEILQAILQEAQLDAKVELCRGDVLFQPRGIIQTLWL